MSKSASIISCKNVTVMNSNLLSFRKNVVIDILKCDEIFEKGIDLRERN